jgi:hypothetical protein
MKSSGIVWTTDQLMAYLKAPRKYVPGVKMMFPGLSDEQDRKSVVAFLATLGPALPEPHLPQRRASIIFHPFPDGSRKPASTLP